MQELLEKLGQGTDLNEQESYDIMIAIMNGEKSNAQIAGFLMGLKTKGESISEISGFVRAMRDKANKISSPVGVIDTCGTGGDGTSTFNISTAAAIVSAAAGVPVAKHGNKSVSSKCGSADVFQEMGVRIDLPPEKADLCLKDIGLVFLFAPLYHPSMKNAVVPRRELGVRTVFNILGPMLNPALVKKQIIGAFNLATAEKIATVLKSAGSEHVLVLHSQDGMDELSISGNTFILELKNNTINKYNFDPQDIGLKKQPLSAIQGGDAKTNAEIIRQVLNGQKSPRLEITALNAGAAIYAAGKVETIKSGVEMAFDTIYSGKAEKKLAELIDYTQSV